MTTLKLTPNHKLAFLIVAAVLVAFAAGYLIAMQLVARGVSAPFGPTPAPITPGRYCQPRTNGTLYACPFIPAN